MWIALYPDMVLPRPGAKQPALKFIPFSRFYEEQVTSEQNKELTAEQIIGKFEEIKRKHQKKA